MKQHPYAVAFIVCWFVAFAILPVDAGETVIGTWIAHGFAAVGGAVVLWLLVALVIYGMRRRVN